MTPLRVDSVATRSEGGNLLRVACGYDFSTDPVRAEWQPQLDEIGYATHEGYGTAEFRRYFRPTEIRDGGGKRVTRLVYRDA